MSAPAASYERHVDESWQGSLDDLRSLLDTRFLGDYDEAPISEGGGLRMICPVCLRKEHYVHALERRADHAEFVCSGGCDEEAIRARLHDVQALAAAWPPEEQVDEPDGPDTSWAPVDLGAVISGGVSDEPPSLLARTDGPCLLYRGKSHGFSGEPESCKGWVALHASVERLSAGEHVLYVDLEDTAATVVSRLIALGASPDAIRERFHYVCPDEPLNETGWSVLEPVLATHPSLVVIDGVTEALVLHGFDVNDNVDIAKWLALLPRPLVKRGAAVIQIDHVGRDRDARGRFPIGGQHKLAGIDVHYGFEVLEPFGRERQGRVKVTVTKDRPGHVRQHAGEDDKVAEVELTSTADGGVSIEVAPPRVATEGETHRPTFRPTGQMERVSRAVEETPGLTKSAIRSAVAGKSEYKDLALELLVNEGYIEARRDGQAHHHHSIRAYREADEE